MTGNRRPVVFAAAVLAIGAGALVAGEPRAGAGGGVTFDDRAPGVLVVRTPAYRLALSKQTGALVALDDLRHPDRLLTGQHGCAWTAKGAGVLAGGCTAAGVRYRWDGTSSTLTITYPAGKVDAVFAVHALPSQLDLRLRLVNGSRAPVRTVGFPADLRVSRDLVTAGYAPSYLPGVHFGPAFFRRTGGDIAAYPSKGAFADYLALDLGRGSLALYSVNPAPAPLAPVELGFTHARAGACGGASFCLRHAFATWITPGRSWLSPVVRIRTGDPVERSILDYRGANGIDGYPSAAAKLGARLWTLARAPLVKIDPAKGLPPLSQWAPALARLPSPALLHPAGLQAGGFDANDPDFLPPDPRWGTQDDFEAAIADAHRLGQLVMPYLNAGWWDAASPTVRSLPAGQTIASISVQSRDGRPATERFGSKVGYVVSAWAPTVRARFASLAGQFASSDCLFFDQAGSRAWRYDFNPASPTPLAYQDGWLRLFAPLSRRCVMAEDGWDRLAASFSGFHGGLELMDREFRYPDRTWGAGTWEAFPLALWLLHDKVLLYQHDLCECTFTTDPQILTWNLAYGFLLSYTWDEQTHSLDSPWLPVVAAFQRALGPHYAGVALTSYRQLAAGVTETRFGRYAVVANRTGSPYRVGGMSIAPGGFLARTDDGRLVAGALTSPSGPVYRIVENGRTTFAAPVPG